MKNVQEIHKNTSLWILTKTLICCQPSPIRQMTYSLSVCLCLFLTFSLNVSGSFDCVSVCLCLSFALILNLSMFIVYLSFVFFICFVCLSYLIRLSVCSYFLSSCQYCPSVSLSFMSVGLHFLSAFLCFLSKFRLNLLRKFCLNVLSVCLSVCLPFSWLSVAVFQSISFVFPGFSNLSIFYLKYAVLTFVSLPFCPSYLLFPSSSSSSAVPIILPVRLSVSAAASCAAVFLYLCLPSFFLVIFQRLVRLSVCLFIYMYIYRFVHI